MQRMTHHLQPGLELGTHYLGNTQFAQRIGMLIEMNARHDIQLGIDGT